VADSTFTHLVVVGSSAGGIGALSGMVSSLPEDFDAPIVAAQHLDPNRESHLQEILARKSTLPVKTVTEHEPLQAGMVFVVPANRHVNITDSEIDLSSEPLSGQLCPP
jgi:two-component system CheB/CheR fusion protein